MKKNRVLLGLLLAFMTGKVQAMDSQFGYYQAQDIKVDIILKLENELDQAVMAELKSNHFDKSFCPTKRIPVGPVQAKELKLEVNGRCLYGKYNYVLNIADSSAQNTVSQNVMGGYEESSINSMPVEYRETFFIGKPGQGCREFCTIRTKEKP